MGFGEWKRGSGKEMGSLGKGWVGSQTIGKNNQGQGGRGEKHFSEQKEEAGREDTCLEGRGEHRMPRTHRLALLAMMSLSIVLAKMECSISYNISFY